MLVTAHYRDSNLLIKISDKEGEGKRASYKARAFLSASPSKDKSEVKIN